MTGRIIGPRMSGSASRAPLSFTADELEALARVRSAVRDAARARREEQREVNENRSPYALERAYARTASALQVENEALAHLRAALLEE